MKNNVPVLYSLFDQVGNYSFQVGSVSQKHFDKLAP
jgi:hypothetical protein